MKLKIKIIAVVYFVFTAILACNCPEPNNVNWRIKDILLVNAEFKTSNAVFTLDPVTETYLISSLLNHFHPRGPFAIRCPGNEYTLLNKFKGVAITSNEDFSIDEPAGTLLNKYFILRGNRNKIESTDFVSFLNGYYSTGLDYGDLSFQLELTQLPSIVLNHEITFRFLFDDEDITVKVNLDLEE